MNYNPLKDWTVWIAGLVVIILLFFLSSANASSLEEVSNASHKLISGEHPACSSVAISPTQLVTAAHCIPRDYSNRNLSILIEKLDDKFNVLQKTNVYVTAVRTSWDDDTAFLEVKDSDYKFDTYVDFNVKHIPQFGDRLFAIGYPQVGDLTITEGLFTTPSHLRALRVEGTFWKTTIPVTGGNSGGGLYRYSDTTGYELIGLTTARRNDTSFQSYFSTSSALEAVMKGLLKAE